MTVSVGTSAFDGATGTPTPPLSTAQLQAYAPNVTAYRYNGEASKEEGQLNAWSDLGEAAAQAKLREAGGLLGSVVTITYPHGTIVGVAVAEVTGEWQARAGTVNGGVLLVQFKFNRAVKKDDGDVDGTMVSVQTATSLAGTWTTETNWIALAGSDGLGTYAGESQATIVGVGPDKTRLGRWVRIVLKGADPETDRTAIRWVGVIVGVSSSARRDPSQGIGWGAETVYRFAGLAHVLAQLYPTAWYESGETSTVSPVKFQGAVPIAGAKADVGSPLTFNAEGKGNQGVYATQLDAAPAPLVKLHARGLGSGGTLWTAKEALLCCIAHVRLSWPTLPRIVLVDPSAILTYTGTWVVDRLPLLGMLNAILSPNELRTFRLAVDWDFAGGPAVNVVPVKLDATGTAFDLTGVEITDWRCDFDAATQVETWYLDAGRRSFLQTVSFEWSTLTVGGVRGFSSTEETAWDTATQQERDSLKLAHVARRFVLEPVWPATGYLGGDAIPYFRVVDGGGQETGELGTGSDFPSAITAWHIDRTIPLGEGGDWGAAYPGPTLPKGTPAIGPLVFYYQSGQPLEAVHHTLQVSVLDGLAGIALGRDSVDGLAIQAKTKTDGYTILATLSFIHPFSWRVSKITTPVRSDSPRSGITYLPSNAFDRVDAMSYAIVGTTTAGVAVYATAGRRDGGGLLTDVRDRFALWYTSLDGTAEWRRRDLDVLTPDPGTVVASVKVTVATGPPLVTPVVTVGSPITRRVQTWDRTNPGITWSANRIVPALAGDGGKAAVAAANGAAVLGRASDFVDKGAPHV